MCSISGIYQKYSTRNQINHFTHQMNDVLKHRGPDQSSVYLDKEIMFGMGMNRLSILDISSGKQPFVSRCGRYVLIFNGEIINAPEIKEELIRKKIIINSNSDTEILFNFLIFLDGLANLKKLNGMFSFAFYDSILKKLYLVRDRFGIKPLFYMKLNENFYFASEIKAIHLIPNVPVEIDKSAISEYLSLMYVTGNKSIYNNIKKVPSGSLLEYDFKSNNLSMKKWHNFSFINKFNIKNNDEFHEELFSKIHNAVTKWTLSDVSISCSLSGGLDSSIITRIISDKYQKLNTFSLGFEEDYLIDELEEAKEISEICGTRHSEIKINSQDLFEELPKMIDALDEPYGGGLPSWFIYKYASRSHKVILTGTGADEIFGNYGKWRYLDYLNFLNLDKKKFLFNKFYFNRNNYFSKDEKKKLLNNDIFLLDKTEETFYSLYDNNDAIEPRNKTSYIDLTTQLQDEFLYMTDRFSMAHSIEARPCFLENDLVSFALSIPPSIRMKQNNTKYLLRNMSRKYFPEKISNRGKKGFVLPISKWINNYFYKDFANLFEENKIKKQNIFNHNILKNIINPMLHELKRNEHDNKISTKLWSLLMFQMWFEKKNLN